MVQLGQLSVVLSATPLEAPRIGVFIREQILNLGVIVGAYFFIAVLLVFVQDGLFFEQVLLVRVSQLSLHNKELSWGSD